MMRIIFSYGLASVFASCVVDRRMESSFAAYFSSCGLAFSWLFFVEVEISLVDLLLVRPRLHL